MAPRRRSKDSDGSEPRSLGVLLDWASPEEKRSFHFFQHVTAPSLSGDLDAAFWKVLVLQICQTEHAVRHAVLAVSSLHEGLLQGTVDPYMDGGASQSFALQQYNKAISRLLDQMNNAGSKPMASLLTCILFVCIEFMQSKDKESLIHLEQGRQILSQLERKAKSDDPEIECIKEHLVPMYTRLSLTSFLFGGSPVPIPTGLKTLTAIPVTFKSLAELRYCMYDFMDQGLRFTQRARPAKYGDSLSPEHIRALQNEQQHLLSQLAKLSVAFSLFRASKPTAAPEHHMHVLQMYLHAQQIWISTALSTSETAYDDHLASFSAIVPLAASFLEAEQTMPRQPFQSRSVVASFGAPPGFARSAQNSSAANFTFETHVIPPLYYVATKCRHPLIRRSALDLLRKNPERRENLWRASIMGSIAAHVVEVEERWAERSTPPTDFPPPPAAFAKEVNPQDIFARGMSGPFGPDSFRSSMPSRDVASESLFTVHETPTTMFGEVLPTTTATTSIPELSVEDLDLDFDLPIDPALGMMDVEVSSSFSAAPSLSSSQDGASSISAIDPMMAFLAPQGLSNWLTQPVPPPTPAAALHIPPNPGLTDRREHSRRASPSGSSDHSSEMERYANKQSLEAPFDLPEPLRVHDAIIGPEKADGSWVTVFRKLHGSHADWDVLTEYVLV